jgi:hypothetical protein
MSDIVTNLQSESNIPIYANIVFFFILSILFVNENKTKNSKDPYRKQWKETTRYVLIILSLILVVGFIFTKIANIDFLTKYETYYNYSLGALVAAYGLIYLSQYETVAFTMYIVSILILFVGMAILFNVFLNFFKSLRGLTGYFVNFLFFIPCLLSDFVTYMLNEYKATPNTVLVLFAAEILLLLLYTYLPNLLFKISMKDGIPVLENYEYLKSENIISLENELLADSKAIKVFSEDQEAVRREYSFSMWIYLNQHSTSMASYNKETNIFSFGNGKPRITYFNDKNDPDNKDIYRIYFSNPINEGTVDETSENTYYDLKLPSQKWNHLVFNYKSKHVDLFVNGNLIRTFTFKESIPTYNLGDLVTIGSNNGLSGAIANIRYYKKNLSKQQISNIYNILMNKNPPINNL